MRKYTTKGLLRRKEARAGFKEFFEEHTNEIKTKKHKCLECGDRLKGDVSEVAHILDKQKFKSVACNSKNVLYLCGRFSNNHCHSKFDSDNMSLQSMKVFGQAREKVLQLLGVVTEEYNWKLTDKWQI